MSGHNQNAVHVLWKLSYMLCKLHGLTAFKGKWNTLYLECMWGYYGIQWFAQQLSSAVGWLVVGGCSQVFVSNIISSILMGYPIKLLTNTWELPVTTHHPTALENCCANHYMYKPWGHIPSGLHMVVNPPVWVYPHLGCQLLRDCYLSSSDSCMYLIFGGLFTTHYELLCVCGWNSLHTVKL